MALDNSFTNSTSLIKRSVRLKGSKGLLTVDNAYTLIEMPDNSLYFKRGAWKDLLNYDMDNDQEAILFRLLFTDKLRLQYIAGNMFFDSIYLFCWYQSFAFYICMHMFYTHFLIINHHCSISSSHLSKSSAVFILSSSWVFAFSASAWVISECFCL